MATSRTLRPERPRRACLILDADEYAVRSIESAISRNYVTPADHLEIIVDHPIVANWRLKQSLENPRRVRLAYYGLNGSDLPSKREADVNAALAAIAYETMTR